MKINFLPNEIIRRNQITYLNKSLIGTYLALGVGLTTLYTIDFFEKEDALQEITILQEELTHNISKSNNLLDVIQNNELYSTLNANGKLDIQNLLDDESNINNFSYRFDNLLYYVINSTPNNVQINRINISPEQMIIEAQAEDFESMETIYNDISNLGLTELEQVTINPLNEDFNMNIKESISFNLITVFTEKGIEEEVE